MCPFRRRCRADWPMRECSRFCNVAPHLWHVQVMGSGPLLLLLHGTGASTHTWRALAPLLARDYTLVMPDLPGQGFTRLGDRTPLRARSGGRGSRRASAPPKAGSPQAIIGHSAGAAIALRMAGLLPVPPKAIVGINAALAQFRRAAGAGLPGDRAAAGAQSAGAVDSLRGWAGPKGRSSGCWPRPDRSSMRRGAAIISGWCRTRPMSTAPWR